MFTKSFNSKSECFLLENSRIDYEYIVYKYIIDSYIRIIRAQKLFIFNNQWILGQILTSAVSSNKTPPVHDIDCSDTLLECKCTDTVNSFF